MSNHAFSIAGVRARFSLSIALGFILSVHLASADVIDSSLKMRLNFDAAPVGDVVVDTSPAGAHPGTNNLATWVASEASRTGVMIFDGLALNQIAVAPAPDFDSTVGTIAFWMKSTNVTENTSGSYAMLFDRRAAAGDVIFQDPSGRIANQVAGNVNSQTTAANVTDGNWHHLAYVYDQAASGSISFYVDGVLDVTGPNAITWNWTPSQQLEIGASHETFWSGYTGFLDDFRIYNRMLTSSEIADVAGLGTNALIVINTGGQPQDLTAAVNDTPAISVKATVVNGDPAQLHYQWQSNGVPIVNATNPAYSLTVTANDNGKKFNVLLSYPGATNLTSAEATLTVVPELTLIYSFDAAPVGDVIIDTTTNVIKHNGTNVGAIWAASEDGHSGVMSFDGIAENQITVAPVPEFDSVRGTIAFWMKSTNVTATPNPYAAIFGRRAPTGGDVIYQEPGGHLANQAQIPGSTVNEQTTVQNVTDNKWHHIAYLYDQRTGGSVSFYVDGALDTSKVNSAAWAWVPEEQLIIGDASQTFWAAYTGFLDEFRIYNRVLAPAEVAELAGLGSQPQIVVTRPPASVVTGENDNPNFSVAATVVNGNTNDLHYQWLKDGVVITNATSSTYSLTVTTNDNGRKLSVQFSYPGATNVTSAEATLTVMPRMVLIYNFDAAPVADVIVDTTPDATKHDGANVGATWAASEAGHNGVMSFDGIIQNQITVAPVPEFNSQRGTIAFWMKSSEVVTTPNQYAAVFDRRVQFAAPPAPTGGDVIYQDPLGYLNNQAQTLAGTVNGQATAINVTDNKWHHIAYLYDQRAGSLVSFYVDGALDTSKANSAEWIWVPDQQLEIGDSHDNFWAGYDGFLDEFRIYNRVLSASEIAELAGAVPNPTSPTLQSSVAQGKLTLSWSATGFALQENSDLGNPAGWTAVPNGDVSPVVITLPATGNKYYRLKNL